MPVYLWPMPLIFWWKSTGWFVLIAGDSTGKNSPHTCGLSIFCGHDRQLVYCAEAVKMLYVKQHLFYYLLDY